MASVTIFRANVEGVSKLAVKRLCKKAGCNSISPVLYHEIRKVIMVFAIRVLAVVDSGATLTSEGVAKAVRTTFGEVGAAADLEIAKAVVVRIMKEVSQNLDKKLKFAKDAVPTFQSALENYVVMVITEATVRMTMQKRTMLMPQDISDIVGYSDDDEYSTITGVAYREK